MIGVLWANAMAAKSFELKSPSGEVSVTVDIGEQIRYSVYGGGKPLLTDSSLALCLREGTLGDKPHLTGHKASPVNRTFRPVVAFKFEEIRDRCNMLRLDFRGGWAVEFRAYDDGMAYRFVTALRHDIEVLSEKVAIRFPDDYTAVVQQPGGFKTAYEEPYSLIETNGWKPGDPMSVLPVLIDTRQGYKLLLSESALSDYPCMFLEGDGANGMKGTFPKVPLAYEESGDRSMRILQEADYIARTKGTRAFPWRYFVIAKDDGQLIENTMTARLAEQQAIADASWIEPGQVSWEFWNAASPYGPDVDFVAGFNTATYKYYIDFAAEYGIPYIIMDEGWARSTRDPYTPNPAVDVHELIRYGREKGVGIILWMTWLVVENHFEMFEELSKWGVKGVKIDFMDRSDQWMVNYYERVAAEAARHKMVVAFHGSFKPAGLEYKYPNVLAYEGVRGMENMGGCTPANSVWFPFIRNAVGPMDYTPGAMLSMQPESYCGNRPNAASIGTRTYQMALFVLFETGLQMLADNPTLYYRNDECTRFISRVPVTWDETRALEAVAGKFAVVAKRKGDKWYVGAINGSNEGIELEIPLDFLTPGKNYTMTGFEDGINAFRQAMDYRKTQRRVDSTGKATLKIARNGGWAAVIE
ncbi:glycoside hydrolase family 97 protein [Alistipes onderdonkii]|jgi:putative alpha-glucosidase|uniref:Glycoside hydrolase family 97 protein n=2 Tax=Alistipes onderdonkii TaxID=328813 RepID=A0A5B3H3N8_9BACT|nr:glycoside hydrolase family 97 protein [Alistipes onderdonkii]KAA2381563.1 glycoside hydrolase family 97 protein [Alistipes onderdonkii]KAA2386042.1 glycoside hydrolase family 97 protein [Alistipes onderdonkii]KAA2390643.1 glycoside hydrolase family 97 protein [Alistipes onderdonkii]KAA2394605.1 glycoside hydrolase family 97 protein [Alistipes onderdonkii]